MSKKSTPAFLPIADLDELAASVTRRRHAEIDMDETVLDIERQKAIVEQRFATELSRIQATIDTETVRQMAYLKAHKSDFDGPPRSYTFTDGTVGYRLGQKHLEPVGKLTWKKVLEKVLALGNERFVRRVPEVNRDNILEDEKTLGETGLKDLGLKVVQRDEPYVEIRRDEIDGATAAAGETA